MAQTDLLRRLLDAGAAFTEMTRSRAESIVQELVRAGEIGVDQVQSTVQELVDRSRENTENLVATVRAEVTSQLGAASADDVSRLEQRLAALEGARAGAATQRAPARSAAAKKTATPRKATAAKKTAAPRKAAAKKAAAKKPPPARKAAAKKASARRRT